MSILLQALKKSESQRELGNVPTLQTDTELLSPGEVEPPLWMPALLVLLAALLITWFGLDQYRVPDEVLERSLAQQGSQHATESLAETNQASTDKVTESERGQPSNSILPRLSEAVDSSSNLQETQQEQRRLGREVRNYAAEKPAARQPVASTPKRDNAVGQSEVVTVELDRAKAAPLQPPFTKPEQGTDSDQAYEPEMISYWQVPEKMREGLPDLRISVLVFAEQPESRFLLLNGQRMREGETLDNGLLLEEIRRDRAVFNYRNYRFFLKS